MLIDNPVKRLKEDIDALIRANTELTKEKSTNYSIIEVLKKQYGYDADSSFYIALENWILLGKLNNSARERVEKLGNVSDFHIRPFTLLDRAFKTSNLDNYFNNIKPMLEGETSVALNFCMDLVFRDNDSKEVDVIKINDIKKDIEGLLNKIESYEIDEEIRLFVFNQLEVIHKVLHYYNLYGIEGIEEVLEKTIGAICRRYNTSEVFRESNIKNDLFDILGKIDILVGLYTSVPPLLQQISDIIIK